MLLLLLLLLLLRKRPDHHFSTLSLSLSLSPTHPTRRFPKVRTGTRCPAVNQSKTRGKKRRGRQLRPHCMAMKRAINWFRLQPKVRVRFRVTPRARIRVTPRVAVRVRVTARVWVRVTVRVRKKRRRGRQLRPHCMAMKRASNWFRLQPQVRVRFRVTPRARIRVTPRVAVRVRVTARVWVRVTVRVRETRRRGRQLRPQRITMERTVNWFRLQP